MGLFPTPYNLVAHLGGDFFPRCKKVTDVILTLMYYLLLF